MEEMLEQKNPLRHFHGIGVSKTSFRSLLEKHDDEDDILKALDECESDLKICCTPYDENGKSIHLEGDKIFEESNHDKNFLFAKLSGNIKITEIHYFGRWEEYEFCGAPHCAWAPEIEYVGLSHKEQIRAFQMFKYLVVETEKINGFPITDERHDLFSKPEFRKLLIRILNSKRYLSI